MSGPDTVTTVEEARAAGLLADLTVEQAMDRAVLLGEDSGEITLYRDCEWWHVYPVGGPWSRTDAVPNVSAHCPRLALAMLLALPAHPRTEEPA